MRLSHRLFALSALALAIAPSAYAINFGVYDARSLAMGGAGTAVGNPDQAAFYNPALLALSDKDEDTSGNGRFYFPTLVGRGSTAITDVADAIDNNLDTKLSNSVNAFNAQADATTAAGVSANAKDLRSLLNKVANRDLDVDAFIGLSVSEPSVHSGGAFYFGSRIVGSGASKVSKTDLALLDEYIAAMDMMAQGSTLQQIAVAHPNLVDANGLKDPTQSLNSTANVGGLAVTEWGLAMSKEVEHWGQHVAFGITPKLVRLDAYIDNADFNNGQTVNTGFSSSTATLLSFNADIGVVYTLFDKFHISWVEKDAFDKEFVTKPKPDPDTGLTQPGLKVKMSPRSRAGLSYTGDDLKLGVDYDLKPALPLSAGSPSQEVCMGAEYRVWGNLRLRVGRTQDRTGFHTSSTTGGLGWKFHRFVIDLAYAQSSTSKAAGLQMGLAF